MEGGGKLTLRPPRLAVSLSFFLFSFFFDRSSFFVLQHTFFLPRNTFLLSRKAHIFLSKAQISLFSKKAFFVVVKNTKKNVENTHFGFVVENANCFAVEKCVFLCERNFVVVIVDDIFLVFVERRTFCCFCC